MENQLSMLPQPTARPVSSVMRALTEVSEADNNSRNAMPPPPSTNVAGLKRQGSNLPEPAQKRKTLSERAGEPVKQSSNISSQNISNTNSLYRSSSNASTLSRTTTTSSRNTSNSSYTGSLNSGIRPPASLNSGKNNVRPKSSYGTERGFGAASRPGIPNFQAPNEASTNKSKDPPSTPLRGPRSMQPMNSPICETIQLRPKPMSMSNLRTPGPKRLPSVVVRMRDQTRDVSLSTQLGLMRLDEYHQKDFEPQLTPTKQTNTSKIPRVSPLPMTPIRDNCPRLLRRKSPMKLRKLLTPHSNLEIFDPDEPYKDFKKIFEDYKQMSQAQMDKIDSVIEEKNVYREKMSQLEQERSSHTESMIVLKTEIQNLHFQVESAGKSIEELKRQHEHRLDETRRGHREDLDALRQEQKDELERLKTEHREEMREAKQRHQEELERERSQKIQALSQVSTQGALEKQRHQTDLDRKDHEIASARLEIERVGAALEREKQVNNDLRGSLRTAGDNASSMESARQGLQAKVAYLESDSKSQSEAYAAMEKRMYEAIAKSEAVEEKLRSEETHRRKLHNQVQELKGNIRVFCRVRPTLLVEEELARMKYPEPEESTDIEVRGVEEKSAVGRDTTKTHPFSFDRVFNPQCSNDQVFEEISQLIQSALDGFNVCIFAYGQTGSGKTYTMSSKDGMIPRALRQIYSRCKDLEDRGWKYKMEGSFIEVYNEELRDLLGNQEPGSKKYEIHHDMQAHETTITNITTLSLDNEEQVESILSQAMTRRSVAATQANEHSSRSHSVFILKLVGKNSITGDESKGTLNLVDLAGSERIKNAATSGQRLEETKAINKSLSCLGDVIQALGQGQAGTADARSSLSNGRDSSGAIVSTAHIPYRNSKLTYLLQLSLGGNCKTLMFVMVAPEKKCLNETITSLKFAEKVSRTRIGVAKRVK